MCACLQPGIQQWLCALCSSVVSLRVHLYTGYGCCGSHIVLHVSSWDCYPTPASCSVHPDTSKLRVLAELAIHPLATAVEEVAAGVADEERQDAQLQGLPPPMIPGVRHTALSSCYRLVRTHFDQRSSCSQLCLHATCGRCGRAQC